MKQVSLEVRQLIINYFNEGKTVREIAKIVKRPKSTVGDIIKKYKIRKTVVRKQYKPRDRKLTNVDERFLLREIKKDPFTSAVKLTEEIKKMSGKEVSSQTVRRVLHRAGLKGRTARRKPFISEKNRKKRLAFAKEHMDKDFSFWSRVLFTDESKYNLFGSDGRRFVWRRRGEEYLPKNTTKSVKHGGGSVMVWGCVSASGVGDLHFIKGNMDKHQYLDILRSHLRSSVAKLGISDNFIFYQDNDPKHTAGIVKEWLLYNCPKVLQTCPQSPDLNVIEHVWDYMETRIRQRHFSNLEEMKKIMQEEWQKIEPSFCQKLVQSMPRRIQAVEEQKGYATKY